MAFLNFKVPSTCKYIWRLPELKTSFYSKSYVHWRYLPIPPYWHNWRYESLQQRNPGNLPKITPICVSWFSKAQDMRQPTVSLRRATHSTLRSWNRYRTGTETCTLGWVQSEDSKRYHKQVQCPLHLKPLHFRIPSIVRPAIRGRHHHTTHIFDINILPF